MSWCFGTTEGSAGGGKGGEGKTMAVFGGGSENRRGEGQGLSEKEAT